MPEGIVSGVRTGRVEYAPLQPLSLGEESVEFVLASSEGTSVTKYFQLDVDLRAACLKTTEQMDQLSGYSIS
jgi:hypothetical protein